MSAKYIILADDKNEYAVIFDHHISHIDAASGIQEQALFGGWSKVGRLRVVAAGFVGDPITKSESLKLGPRPQDRRLLMELVDGKTSLPTSSVHHPFDTSAI